jgi:hypothetical protein
MYLALAKVTVSICLLVYIVFMRIRQGFVAGARRRNVSSCSSFRKTKYAADSSSYRDVRKWKAAILLYYCCQRCLRQGGELTFERRSMLLIVQVIEMSGNGKPPFCSITVVSAVCGKEAN